MTDQAANEMSSSRISRSGVGPIHHVVINVTDLNASLGFYRDVLGLQHDMTVDMGGRALETLLRLPPGSEGTVAFLRGGRGMGRLELMEWRSEPGSRERTTSRDRSAMEPGFSLMSFLVTEAELRRVHDRLRAMNYTCWSEPVEIAVGDTGALEIFVSEDPDGNPIEFFVLPAQDTEP